MCAHGGCLFKHLCVERESIWTSVRMCVQPKECTWASDSAYTCSVYILAGIILLFLCKYKIYVKKVELKNYKAILKFCQFCLLVDVKVMRLNKEKKKTKKLYIHNTLPVSKYYGNVNLKSRQRLLLLQIEFMSIKDKDCLDWNKTRNETRREKGFFVFTKCHIIK